MTFVLAHLSDPHLGPVPRARARELFGKRAIGYWNWHRRRHAVHQAVALDLLVGDIRAHAPDHIAVTGDLVNVALTAEFAPARRWLETLGPPQDVTIVPGNHDAYVGTTALHAHLHWDAYMRGDDGAEIVFPFVRRRGNVALIGLSTAVATAPFMATGRLGRRQLAALAPLLTALEREGLFRVVLIHHPPVTPPARRFKRLTDGRALRETLAVHGAELLIHGHDHVHLLTWLDGPRGRIPAVGVPSASATDPNHDLAAYNLYTVDGEPGAWRCVAESRCLAAEGDHVVSLKRQVLHDGGASDPSSGRPPAPGAG